MQDLLDTVVSSLVLMTIVLMGLILGGTLLIMSKALSKWVRFPLAILLFMIGFLMLIGLPFGLLGWGYSDNIQWVHSDGTTVYAVESRKRGSSRGGRYRVTRVHALDKATGRRIYRQVINEDKLAFSGPNLLFGSSQSFGVLNLQTRELHNYDRDAIAAKFPVLSAGVDQMNYDDNCHCLVVASKTGKTYYLDPYSMELRAEAINNAGGPRIPKPPPTVKVSDEQTLELKGDPLAQAYGKNHIALSQKTFLHGKVLYTDKTHSFAIIKHFETTDEKNVILTAFTLQGEVIWERDQRSLGVADAFTYDAKLGGWSVSDESFTFGVGGFVVSLDLQTGRTLWKTRI